MIEFYNAQYFMQSNKLKSIFC